jgi:predicted AAA+ superfamily ATPase
MLQRTLYKLLSEKLFKGKTILLIGPRQVGKTTLIHQILEQKEYLFLNGDDPLVRTLLTNPSTKEIEGIIGKQKILFIDEAQRIENIGLTAKIIHDEFEGVQLIMSGSSAFELRNKTSESLTGRKWEYFMYPISYEEYEQAKGYLTAMGDLNNRLIYGYYPEVINHPGQERDILNEITQSVLIKDLLILGNIKKPEVLEKILKALAFQVGSEVSLNEIAQLTGVDKNTVSTYIHLLELAYVILPFSSFSRNLRNEIKMNRKYYFYDNGIRNSLIQNFNPVDLRNDIGALWENFLISERKKRNEYHRQYVSTYFWRTKQQQEVDYLEEGNGKVMGYEFKWNAQSKVKIPKAFKEAYHAEVMVIHKENFREFVMENNE